MSRGRCYISGALMGSRNLEQAMNDYERIAAAIRACGYDVFLPHTRADESPTADPDVEIYERDFLQLRESDLVVAHLGESSHGVGAEVALATQMKIPVIAILPMNVACSRFLLGLLKQNRARAHRYMSLDAAVDWLRQELSRESESQRS